MNRRFFVGQCVAGLAFGIAPISFSTGASSLSVAQPVASLLGKATALIQKGYLGTSQLLTVTHVYSPERTTLASLLTRAPRDLDLIREVINLDLAVDTKLLFADISSAGHLSPSVRLNTSDVTITWQALARVGIQSSAPLSTLRIMGSQGVIQLNMDDFDYKLIDLHGRTVQSENPSTITKNAISRRHVLLGA